MLREITASQFWEWQAFYALEPWGKWIEDARVGLLSSVIANFSMASSKHDFKPTDFMPKEYGEVAKTKADDLSERLKKAFQGMGAKERKSN